MNLDGHGGSGGDMEARNTDSQTWGNRRQPEEGAGATTLGRRDEDTGDHRRQER